MQDERLRVDAGIAAGVATMRPQGEIDLYTVSQLEYAISSAIRADAKAILIDLSGVTYMDSSGLSVLITAYKKLTATGGRLYLITSDEATWVRRVLQITRVDTFIPVLGSLDEAAKELSVSGVV
ncbi:MAG: STAS domain-containing protein [Armatimonadetes bacterium]|nr:STAS domain-containing protein [Armatimonadota bacterium]